REAHQQLPAVEPGLHRAVLLRRAVAGLHGAGLRGGAGVLCLAAAPLRPYRRAGGGCRVTGTRVISAVFIAALLLTAVLWLPAPWSAAALSLILLAAAWEWGGFLGARVSGRLLFILVLAALCLLWWQLS